MSWHNPDLTLPRNMNFDFGEFFYYILELIYMLWPDKKDRKN